jgi:pyruvate,orthophosphate dikinase
VLRHLSDPPRIFVRADAAEPISTGLPASPGVATGAIVTSSDAAEAAGAAGQSVILVRSETSPDDVRGMARAAGVLTSLGGLASHAAVVARGWGIPAVVGARDVRPGADAVEVAGRSLAAGEVLTIDGGSGEIFLGELAGQWDTAPEVGELLAWASELGIEATVDEAEAPKAEGTMTAGSDDTPLTSDDVLRALFVKGSVSPDDLGTALMASPSDVDPLVAALVAEGAIASTKDAVQLTGEGKLRADELFAADRRDIGAERTAELLDQFHAFDLRMKDIVTAWQIREIGGEQVLNDHADAAHDAEVLDRLSALHDGLDGWLDPIGRALRRHAIYRSRLGVAARRAREGDQRFVASPRVDSYHSVWFELHEDLIRLAGRRRSDEAAAGRA